MDSDRERDATPAEGRRGGGARRLRLAVLAAVLVALAAWYLIWGPPLFPAAGSALAQDTSGVAGGANPVHFVPPSQPDFDLSGALVDPESVLRGGPLTDGIPALTSARRVDASEATGMNPEDRVIGLALSGEALALPLRIMDLHEVANDEVGGVPVAVTYCPLCDSVAVFDRRVEGETLEFGVSGLLHNSNVLLYDRSGDRPTDSLWSQVRMEAVSGPRAGQRLSTLPFSLVTWERWVDEHPATEVLSFHTGYPRDYRGNVYRGYLRDPDLLAFPVEPIDSRLPLKEPVLGIAAGEGRLAVVIADLPLGETEVRLGEAAVRVRPREGGVEVVEREGEAEVVHTFWFAWAAMHPGGEIWSRGERPGES